MKFESIINKLRQNKLSNVVSLAGVLCLILLSFASCSSDDESTAPTSADTRNVQVSLTLSLEGPSTRANTDWTDYDPKDKGTAMENYIDVSKLHVCLYTSNGTFVSKADSLLVMSVDTVGSTTYHLIGKMRINSNLLTNDRLTGKIVVYANTDMTNETASLRNAAISQLTYDYTPGSTLTEIPMWGVREITDFSLPRGQEVTLPEINLLRAMAKVSVDMPDSMLERGYRLDRVTLDKYNTQGYVLPAGYNQVSETRLLNYDSGTAQSFNPLASPSTERKEFTDGLIYIPEFDNTNRDATLSIWIHNPNGTTTERTFPIASYTDGVLSGNMNIVRNHYYQFHVYRSNDILIDLDVKQWTVIRHPEIVM